MAIDHKGRRQLALGAVSFTLLAAAGAVWAQKASLQWFDGERWVDSTEAQGPAQAAGGVVVMVPVAQAAALQALLLARGFKPRPLAVAGAYELPSAAGEDALRLTHGLADLPALLKAPVQVAPNWRAGLRTR